MEYIDNVYVINMDESKDRLQNMITQIPIIGKPFIRIPAIVGKDLNFKDIKDKTNFFCRNFCSLSMIGIFMSHYKTWQTILQNNDKFSLIMEDDCELIPDFKKELKKVLDELFINDPDFDFLYLSCGGACDKNKDYNIINLVQKYAITNVTNKTGYKTNKFSFIPEVPVGFNCYIVSNNCVKKLLKYMKTISYHVDVAFLNFEDKFKIYSSSKLLAYQYSTFSQSTQTEPFPIMLNKILDNYKCKKKIAYSYYMSAPLFSIYNFNFTTYLLIIILITLILPNPFKQLFLYFIWIYLIIELIYNPNNISYIIFWVIIIQAIIIIFSKN
jgi:GR25 family glycosyltransferase involved in LPS biosynthesis